MPPFPDRSCLKKLVADHCCIQSNPKNPLRYKEMILTGKEGDSHEMMMMMMRMMIMMIMN